MNSARTIFRWAAVLPVFLLTAVVVGSALILFLFTVASLSLVTWFLPNAQEYLAFWQGNDMGGHFLDGTAWLFLAYTVAFSAAMAIALRVAPSHRIPTAWVLSGGVLLILLGSLVLTLAQAEPHSFSFWYRSIVEMLSIATGCGFGIWQARDNARN
jgi:hypothetical protein